MLSLYRLIQSESMSYAKNIYEARLAVFEHLQGELMALMGIEPKSLSEEKLREEMDAIAAVTEAIFEALGLEVVEVKDGSPYVKLSNVDVD